MRLHVSGHVQKDGATGGLCFHPCKDNNSRLDCFSTLQLQKRAHCALFKYKCCVGRRGQRRSRTHNPQLPHNDAGCWDDRANLCVIYRSSELKGRGFISRVQRERGGAAALLGRRAQLQPKCFFFYDGVSVRLMKGDVIFPVRADQSCSVIPSSAPLNVPQRDEHLKMDLGSPRARRLVTCWVEHQI